MDHFSVPWFNENEWLEVYNGIYAPDSNRISKLNALNILQIWKARSPSLPSGIESTLCVLGVELQNGEEYIRRLAYSTAIMRFINHSLDNEQAKGLSILRAAAKLGIPKWVINLRHETAHGVAVPSLKILRKAAAIAMQWLHDNYWVPQHDFIKYPQSQNIKCNNNAIESLIPFHATCSSFIHVFKITNVSDISEQALRDVLISDIQSLDVGQTDNIKKLFKESLRKIVSHLKMTASEGARAVEITIFHDDSLFLSVDFFMANFDIKSIGALPWQFVGIWEPILSAFHTLDMTRLFTERLLLIIQDDRCGFSHRRIAALWMKEWFNALLKCEYFASIADRFNKNPAYRPLAELSPKELKSMLVQQYPYMKMGLTVDLLKDVPGDFNDINYLVKYFDKINAFTDIYLDNVLALARPNFPKDCKKKLKNLIDVVNCRKFSDCEVVSNRVYTVSDINDQINVSLDDSCILVEMDDEPDFIANNVSCSKIDTGIWQVADDVDWSKCPIGVLPWQMNAERNPLLPKILSD